MGSCPSGKLSWWGIFLLGIVLVGSCLGAELSWSRVVLVETCLGGELSWLAITWVGVVQWRIVLEPFEIANMTF